MENKYPLLMELIEKYKKGELNLPESAPLVYHLNKEREKLGDKFLIFTTYDEFKKLVSLNDELRKKEHELLWGEWIYDNPMNGNGCDVPDLPDWYPKKQK